MEKILNLFRWVTPLVIACCMLFYSSFITNADVNNIRVSGNKRISDETVMLISGFLNSSEISATSINAALKNLNKSGLFLDVKINQQNDDIVIKVEESPVISEILFEGNKILSDEDLSKIISSKLQNAYSKTVVLMDVTDLTAFYKSKGRFNAVVNPQIVSAADNSLKLIYNIDEGEILEVRDIIFIGNTVFSDRKLLSVTPSKKKGIFSFISDADNYSELMLSKDKVALENFYKANGFIDVRVTSSVASLSSDKSEVNLSYNISEGPRYLINNISFDTKNLNLDLKNYSSLVDVRIGDIYNKEKLNEIVSKLEQQVISSGMPLAKVKLSVQKTAEVGKVNLGIVFENDQKLFVERIEIRGNSQTLDEVIRREFNISEGDAFNPLVLRKIEEKLRALGFFSKVDIRVKTGSSVEKAVVIVDVLEAPTGSLNFGVGYSTDTSITGSLSVTERNLLGKGQKLNFNVSAAKSSQILNFGFTEPAFLNRDVSAGINLGFKKVDPMESTYTSNSISLSPSLGFSIGPNSTMSISYKVENLEINSRNSNSIVLQGDHGDYVNSSINSTLIYDKRNSIVEPTDGYILRLSSSLSGLGGDVGLMKNAIRSKFYKGILNDTIVFSAELEGGILENFKGFSRVTDRFKLGGRNFRGFQFGEVGPRDVSGDALGGEKYVMSRLEANFPLGLPKELGLYGGVFSEVGSLWSLEAAEDSAPFILYSENAFRSSAGVSLYWSTPIGPLQFNWANPIDYIEGVDVTETFSLNLATRF